MLSITWLLEMPGVLLSLSWPTGPHRLPTRRCCLDRPYVVHRATKRQPRVMCDGDFELTAATVSG